MSFDDAMRSAALRAPAHPSLRPNGAPAGVPAEARSAKAGVFALDRVAPRLGPRCYVAEGACLVGDIVLGEHCSVWFGAVIRGDNGAIRIGARSNVQDGAIIHCLPEGEVRIGAQVSIGHLAAIHGAGIGDRCLVGIGVVVMDGASIGPDTLVAAGSLVTAGRCFEPGVLLRGSPARVVRALTDRELAGIEANAMQYVARADRFRRSLRRV